LKKFIFLLHYKMHMFINSIRWKIKEHKELIKYGYEHNLILDLINKNYRNDSYKKWLEYPKNLAKSEGYIFSEDTPSRSLVEVFVEKIYYVDEFLPKSNDVILDVGASYGDTSIWYAKKFGAKVYAFEPLEDIYKILLKNIELNKLDIKAYNIAVGNGKIISANINKNMLTIGNVKSIETRTLDSFNFDKVDFIKIDVEGFELFVLDGARETIGKFHPKIILETHTKELYEKSIEFLKDFNYKVKFNKKINGNDYFKDVNLLFLSTE